MNLRQSLQTTHSKANTEAIADWVGHKPARFAALLDLLRDDDDQIVQRAAWVVSTCAARHPELVEPHFQTLLSALDHPPHAAVPRNLLKVLAERSDYPEELAGDLVDRCFHYLESPNMPVAIKVHAMQVVANLSKEYPELGEELRQLIDLQWPTASAGFRARARRVLVGL